MEISQFEMSHHFNQHSSLTDHVQTVNTSYILHQKLINTLKNKTLSL